MVRDLTYLKTKFETGDVPTQDDFYDLLDTIFSMGGSSFDPENITTNLVFTNPSAQELRRVATYAGALYTHVIGLYNVAIQMQSHSDLANARIALWSYPGVEGIALEYTDADGANKINIKGDKTYVGKVLQLTSEPSILSSDLDLVYKKWVLDNIAGKADSSALSSYLLLTNIINVLTDSSTNKALSAAQGKALKDTADALATIVAGKETAANKGSNNGYAPLDSGGKVPLANLPSTLLTYKGQWNASTNTPTLTNPDTTKAGFVYDVSVAGTVFGLTFAVGDWLIYTDAGIPEKSDNTDEVVTVNGQTGAVTLNSSHIAESGSTNLYFTPARQTANTNYIDAQDKKFNFKLSFNGNRVVEDYWADGGTINAPSLSAGLASLAYSTDAEASYQSTYPFTVSAGTRIFWKCTYATSSFSGSANLKGTFTNNI